MNIAAFYARLGQLGINISLSGTELDVEGRTDLLTAELVGELRANKAALIELLGRSRIRTAISRGETAKAGNVLSFAQERLWFLDQLEPHSAMYNIPFALRLLGGLDVAALEQTLDQIVVRHEVLRTRFAVQGETPLQIVDEQARLPLPLTDLSGLPPEQREQAALELVRQDAGAPFDLAQAPLVRVRLIRLAAEQHILVFVMHHIISDGWSIGVLVREVAALYAAFNQGAGLSQSQTSLLPELPIQYADFAHWQRQWLSGAVLDAQIAWWRQQLADSPVLLALPTDRPRPPVQSHRGAVFSFTIPAATTKGITALTRKMSITLFMALTAAFNILLSRYSGQSDICIGTPIANRNRAEIESLIGLFINTLVLRTQVNSHASVSQLLEQVRVSTLGAYAHQDMPFEQLVEVLKPERHTGHSPLFQVMLVLQNAPMGKLELPGLTLAPLATDSVTAKFDLTLNITAGEGDSITPHEQLFATFEYNTDLFDATTIERMAGHFNRLLESITSDPGQRMGELAMLDEAERHQLLVEWNDTATEYPKTATIHQLFEGQAASTPDNVAVVFEGQQITYAELNALANQLAHYLRSIGVGPDRLVGICVERSIEMIIGLLGILKAGGAYLPLDPAAPSERLAYMLGDALPLVLLTQQRLLETLPIGGIPTLCLDSQKGLFGDCSTTNPLNVAMPGNLAYVIYTSGSTGRPKGVMLKHDGLCNLAQAQVSAFAVHAGQRVLQFASFNFDASTWEIFMALGSGATLCLAPSDQLMPGISLKQTLEDLAINIATLPPVVLSAMTPASMPLLQTVIAAGEFCSHALVAQWADNHRFMNAYGPTEATVCASMNLCSTHFPGAPPIGCPIANTQIHLLDSTLNPVPVGVTGELYIAGYGLARGYLNRPDLTADKFIPNPFSPVSGARMYQSGDLARYLPDGNIEYLGRIDDQVKIRGFRIELGEIEAALAALPQVREAIVMAREDISGDAGDKRLVAYIIGQQPGLAPETVELRSALARSLPDYMIPAHFMVLDEFPLTPNGKINRKALPHPAMVRGEDVYVPPRTATEAALAQIWAEVLKLDRVGVEDNFFALGGHSLLAITLLQRMRGAGFHAEVRTLFATPTIEALAATVGTNDGTIITPPNRIPDDCHFITPDMLTLVALTPSEIARIVQAVPGGAANIQDIYPLAPLQEGILFHHMMQQKGDAYLLPTLVGFKTRARLDAFTHALQTVLERHDILRTAVLWDGLPAPVQVVWRKIPIAVEEVDFSPEQGDISAQLGARYNPSHYRLDVREAPLLRGFIAQDSHNGRWLLQIVMHHLVGDHTALEIMVEEIRLILAGQERQLAAALPFRHFVAQARLGVSQAEHDVFFKEMLSDVFEPTTPFGLIDVQGDGSGIQESRRTVDPVLSQRIRQAARKLGVSAASLMHLAWAQVLSKTSASKPSGRQEVVFGTVLFGRMQGGAGADRALGMFINTLPIRIRLSSHGVAHSARETHKLLAQLLQHEHASLGLTQRCSGIAAPTPLFSALLNYRHSAPTGQVQWDDMEMLYTEERTNYPLSMSVDDSGTGFGLIVQVNGKVAGQRITDYMHTTLEQLVEALETRPEMLVSQLDILPATERHQLLVEWNDTATAYPKTATIHQLFEVQAASTPDNVAVVFEGQQITYAELNALANRLAHYLRSIGVGPDVLVGICVERSIEMIIGLLGILKAGGAYVPLDPAYPQERLAYMLGDAEPLVLLTQQHLLPHLAPHESPDYARTSRFCFDTDAHLLDAWPSGNPPSVTLPDHLAYVLYTSGSTGRPKGVMIEQHSLVNLACGQARKLRQQGCHTLLQFASINFDMSIEEIFPALIDGASLIIRPSELMAPDADFLALIESHQIDALNLPTAFWHEWVNLLNDGQSMVPASIKMVFVGGEKVNAGQYEKWLQATRAQHGIWVNAYGPTESTVNASSYASVFGSKSLSQEVPIGSPIANTRIYLLDAHLNPVPVGVAGELYIAGDGLARGYLNRPDLTADKFIPNPFSSEQNNGQNCAPGLRMYQSGDLARYLPDGNIEYLGRIDDQVKIRGFRIESGEIEAALVALPQVREAVVMARDEISGEASSGGKRLVAYIIGQASGEALGQAPDKGLGTMALRTALARSLPDYMIPAHFIILDQFPLMPNGKINRRDLPAPDMVRGGDAYVAPRTATEAELVQIWAEVLKLDRVGVEDNFFALGGHSLLAITLLERMRGAGFHAEVRTLFATPTIEALAATVDVQHRAIITPPNRIPDDCQFITPDMLTLVALTPSEIERIVQAVPGGAANIQDIYPLAPLQEGILFHHMMQQEGDAYLQPTLVGFKTRERLAAFTHALQTVLERHDILRTAVLWDGLSAPVQVVWRKIPLAVEEVDFSPEQGDISAQLGARYNPGHYRLDVGKAPLLRGFIAQDSHNGRWLLQIVMHHLVSDHTTLEILIKEIWLILEGQEQQLAAVVPFRHFVAQARLGVSQAEHDVFFKEMLSDVFEPTMPFGLIDVQGDGTGIQESRRTVDLVLSQRIRQVARKLGVSAASLMHLAWAQVLSKISASKPSGQQEVVFGTVLFGRMQGGTGADRAMGMFINTLPIRIRLGNQSVVHSARETHKLLAQLLRHEHASLALAQRCSGIAAPMPLFSALLNYRHSAPTEQVQWDDMEMLYTEERTNYPLIMSVDDLGAGFELTVQVNERVAAQRITDYMHTTLEQLIEALETRPEMPVSQLDILPATERHQLLVEWNNTATEYPKMATIHQLFEAQAANAPDNVAVVFEEQQISYAELNALANRLAHYLRSIGVGPDVLVGICVERSIDMVIGLLGILKAGGAYVPLDPAYPQERLAYMLGDAKPLVLLTQQHLFGTLPMDGIQTLCLDKQWALMSGYSDANPVNATLPGNLAYVIYTSGSTGQPKGTLLQHVNVSRLFSATKDWFNFNEQDTWTLFHSYAFDFSVWEIWGALLHGGKLVIVPYLVSRSPEQFYALLQQEKVTVLNQTPSAFQQLVQVDLIQTDPFSLHLRQVIFGGEALNQVSLSPWFDRHNYDQPQLINMYGITETTVHVTWHLLRMNEKHHASIGRPIPDLGIYLLDTHLNPVPIGVAGELYVAGDGLARGYLNRPDLTAGKFIPNPFGNAVGARMYRSGDLARYLPDGRIEYLGRIDDQVKIRGFRIELGEIEAALAALPQVREAIVLAREDIAGDKRLVAYIIGQLAGLAPDTTELRTALARSLPDYMIPAHFMVLGQFPLTSNGKINRKAMPMPDMVRGEDAYVAPRTATEAALVQISAEVLKLDRVGVQDNFFAIGGHSLLATQMVSRIRTTFRCELPLRRLFEAPTVEALAHQIDLICQEHIGSMLPPITPVERNQALPLSFAQQRLWFLDQFEPGSAFYNMPAALRLSGQLDVAALRRTVNAIVQRHESLRTHFEMIDGLPVQVIVPTLELALPVFDIVELSHAEREARALKLAQNEAETPFNLTTGPVVRASLIRMGEAEHILLFTLHHICSDGWSMGVLVREVAALYAAFNQDAGLSQGQTGILPELPIQYADFAYWQRQWLSGAALDAQLAYWTQQLADSPVLLALPTDRPRQSVQSHRGAVFGFTIPAATAKALTALTRQTHTTLFMALTAAFNILLSRYSGQSDICIGTPIANRNRAEIESLIGFFVNTLVLRTQVNSHASVSQLLEQVRVSTLDAYGHQDVPFEQLVEVLKPERHTGHSPLFQVMLVLLNTPMGKLELPGLTLAPLATDSVTAKFDLTLNITVGESDSITPDEQLLAAFEYNTDLFDATTIARMAGHFMRLLDLMTADPLQQLGALTMLDEAERYQLLVEWNDTATKYPKMATIHQLFETQAASTPDNVAVVFEGQQITYAELNALANQLAHYLRNIGVGPDVLVGICVERSIEMVIGLLGILKAGGAYVPLDPAYPQERLAYMLGDAEPLVLLTQQHLLESLPTEGIQILCIDSQNGLFADCSTSNPVNITLPDNLAYVIYTSGSTGRPKGIGIAHKNTCAFIDWAHSVFDRTSLSRVLGSTSICFDLSIFEIFAPLCQGGACWLVRNILDLSANLSSLPVTMMNTVPSAMASIHRMNVIPASVKVINLAGEALSNHLVQDLYQHPSVEHVFNLYGPTEDTTYSTYALIAKSESGFCLIGRPIANTQIYLLDADLNPVPMGVAGELHIAGDGLARGYLKRPDLTADKFIPNPFSPVPGARMYQTGDLARYLSDGNIEYLGRMDDQVKIRGFRIELGEIETALTAMPQVRQAIVMARDDFVDADSPGDKRLVAYIIPQVPDPMFEMAQLRTALLQALPDYMIPAHFVILDQFPLTPNGKINRRALPLPAMVRGEDAYVPPRTTTEAALVQIWAEVLKLDRVGVQDNFFVLGGHSLLAITLLERMRGAGFHAEVRTLFATPTIAALAAAVGAGDGPIVTPPNRIPDDCQFITPDMLTLVQLSPTEIARIVQAVPGGAANIQDIYPLAPLQEGILFHHMMQQEGDAYLIPTLVSFKTRERLDAFTHALQTVLERHDILRTSVLWDGLPAPVQVVWRKIPIAVEEIDFVPEQGDISAQLGARYNPSHYRLDVRQAPLIRGFIAQDSDNGRWLLQIVMHHLVSDHTTLEMMVEEIRLILAGQEEQLAAALPFRHFVAQARLGGGQAEHDVFFKEMLSDVFEPTTPFGLIDVQGDGSGMQESHRTVDPVLGQRIRQAARKLGVSAASLMHLAWAQVLSKTSQSKPSGQQEVVFGTVLFGRMQGGAGADRAMGMFINTLPIHIRLRGQGVAQSVRETHELLTQLFRHEHASLALAQRCSGIAAPMPLFSALLNYRHSAPTGQVQWDDMEMLDSQERTNYPLTMSVDDLGAGFGLTVQVNGKVAAQRITDYMHTTLEQLIEALETRPELPVSQLDILPAMERHQLLVEWNDTATEYPKMATLHQLFEAQAANTPDNVAVVFEGQQITYAELNARANQLAHYLRSIGVGPDVLVCICVERSIEMVIGLFGILKAGGAYVPLDPAYPQERLAYMLGDAKPLVLLTQHRLLGTLPADSIQTLCLDSQKGLFDDCSPDNPANITLHNNLAYVIYTSGSTGKPKGVGIDHAGIVNRLQWMQEAYGLTETDRVLQKTPFSFDVSVWEFFWPLATGAALVVAKPGGHQDVNYLFEIIASESITTLHFVPPMLEVFLTAMEAQHCATLKRVICSGQALPPVLQQRFFTRLTNTALHNLYGPTEASVDVTFWQCQADGQTTCVPIGYPIANIQIHLLDADLNPVPVGVAGELYIAGIGLARGYLNRSDLTADKFIPNPFSPVPGARMYQSGDLARYLPDGNIEYLGRIDAQVKIRGFRIELGEIETVFATLPGVSECVVMAREDSPGDQRLVAYWVGQQDITAPEPAALRSALLAHLPEFMVPAHFVLLERLPLTVNGKVDRRALPAPERSSHTAQYEEPESPVEQALAEIWIEVLGLEKVSRHDNFFELGGHSLLATQLNSKIRMVFEVVVPLREFFEQPTIAASAIVIETLIMQEIENMSDDEALSAAANFK